LPLGALDFGIGLPEEIRVADSVALFKSPLKTLNLEIALNVGFELFELARFFSFSILLSLFLC
jgi:hypothetical protein